MSVGWHSCAEKALFESVYVELACSPCIHAIVSKQGIFSWEIFFQNDYE